VPSSHTWISPGEGTHKGCPYDVSTVNLNAYGAYLC
jgi:hypothetical protein